VAVQGSLQANANSLIDEAQKNPGDVDSSAFDFTIADTSTAPTSL
jgi:hypothetical protein